MKNGVRLGWVESGARVCLRLVKGSWVESDFEVKTNRVARTVADGQNNLSRETDRKAGLAKRLLTIQKPAQTTVRWMGGGFVLRALKPGRPRPRRSDSSVVPPQPLSLSLKKGSESIMTIVPFGLGVGRAARW